VRGDGHANERHPALLQVARTGLVEEQGLVADVRRHIRLGGLEDEPGDALVQLVHAALALLGRQPVRGADNQHLALRVHEGDGAAFHAQGLGQNAQHLGQRPIELEGRVDDLADGRKHLQFEIAKHSGHAHI